MRLWKVGWIKSGEDNVVSFYSFKFQGRSRHNRLKFTLKQTIKPQRRSKCVVLVA